GLELLHLAGSRIETANDAGELTGPPDRAVGRRQRIVRARSERGDDPFPDVDVRVAGNDARSRPRLLWKVFREVICDRRGLILRQRYHGAEHADPFGARVS